MMIKVSGIVNTNAYNSYPQQEKQTKYYQPEQPKQVLKEDFGILLDEEIKKLHFDKII